MVLSGEAAGVVARLAKAVPAVREERKVFALALTLLAGLFRADAGAIYVRRRATGRLILVKALRLGGEHLPWNLDLVGEFFRNEKPELAAGVIMAPVRLGREVVGVLALARENAFEPGAGKIATEILKIVGQMLGSRRRTDILEASSSVAAAMARGVAPKDIAYRIMHQLRRFIDYDHGATVVERIDDATARVVARQVAWKDGKSDLVGKTFALDWGQLDDGCVVVERGSSSGLWDSLSGVSEHGAPAKASMIIGRLAVRGVTRGLIEIASSAAGYFGESDTAVLAEFLPYLSLCLGGKRGQSPFLAEKR